jgi:hypothetical protein
MGLVLVLPEGSDDVYGSDGCPNVTALLRCNFFGFGSSGV